MTEIVSLVLPLVGLIVIGILAGRAPTMALAGRRVVDWLLRRLSLPALLFGIGAGVGSGNSAVGVFALSVGFATYCAFAIGFTISALRVGGDIRAAGIEGARSSHGALAHLGPAVVLPAFGPAAGLPFALFFVLDGILVRIILPVLWAIGGRDRPAPAAVARGVGRLLVEEPAFLAFAAGLALALLGVELPPGLDEAVGLLGSSAAALGLIGLGLALAAYRDAEVPTAKLRLSPAVIVKLFLQPAIVYLLLGWVGDFDPAWMFTAVFLSALPSAPGIAALAAGSRDREAMDAPAATGLVISILTITALVALTSVGVIPADPFPAN